MCASSFFGGDDKVAKDLLTKIYRKLTWRSLSSENNSCVSKFSTLTEICAEINARIANLFSENQEKRKNEKSTQEMQISEQYDFFGVDTGFEQDNDLPSEVETENKLKDIEIHYKESILETASEIEEKAKKDDQYFFEEEERNNKVEIEANKDKEIDATVETIDSVVKREEPLKFA